jgi:hypothetical protein
LKRKYKLLSTYKTSILLIACLALLASCSQTDIRPRPHMSEQKFIDVLLDMHIATTAKQLNLLNALDTLKKDKVQQMILDKHEVKKVDLLYAIDFYTAMPDTMAALYNKMIEKLSAQQAELSH